MTKRILMSILVLTLVISLCACGNNNKKNDPVNDQIKEMQNMTNTFKDKETIKATNNVVKSSLKNPAKVGDWIVVETYAYDNNYDSIKGDAKIRVSEIYTPEDSRKLLNDLYESEEKLEKELWNRMTAEERAEMGEFESFNIWEDLYKSSYPVQALKMVANFSDFKHNNAQLGSADYSACIVDSYGETLYTD